MVDQVGCMVRRDAATLLPMIRQHIVPGNTIISDLWAAYNTLGTQGYQHYKVNKSYNFVDPITCVLNTLKVCSKRRSKNTNKDGTLRELLDTYLGEFM